MKEDFSGYATKAGLKCSDGRTIMNGAFKHQDKTKVPLVWQHGHSDPENVLGYAILEHREDGVYARGFFNDSPKAAHARSLVEHGDITMMSIWANDLIERAKMVLHGAIREVSLVLSGANPGARIENVTIRHSDGDDTELEDEAIIHTGLALESKKDMSKEDSLQESFDAMSDEQKEELYHMLGEELAHKLDDDDEDLTIKDVYESMSEVQKQVLHYMIGEAIESATKGELKQDNLGDTDNTDNTDMKGTNVGIKHNVFEKGTDTDKPVLSHADIEGIVADATRFGSLKDAVQNYAISHGIENIEVLFPEAAALEGTPEWFKRRSEWVGKVLGGTRKSPFSRVKTVSADLTVEEARAKGYVKGEMKREEFFGVSKRSTTPTTIYKKQKLDRDDMIDITDFDVVSWLKGEMRIMLDEEIARAILIGDGRDVAHEDKINEQNIRPIARDHELYTTVLNVNIGDANSSVQEIIDAIVLNRKHYRGSGMPTFFTTETYIAQFLLLKDTLGRRLYKSLDELASELRVSEIVPVEVLEEEDDLVGILVNMADYVVGADKGGQLAMFDDFDIDYNQYKYLIETRISGALTRLKSAMVVKSVNSGDQLVTPAEPAFDGNNITITDQTGVVYTDASDDSVMTAAGSPYAVATGESFTVNAAPAPGYYFATSEDDTWTFIGE